MLGGLEEKEIPSTGI